MNELAAENQADFLCFYKWSHLQINTKSYLYWWTNISIQQENSFEVKRYPVLQKEALYLVWIRQVDHQTRRDPGPWKSLDRVPLYQLKIQRLTNNHGLLTTVPIEASVSDLKSIEILLVKNKSKLAVTVK